MTALQVPIRCAHSARPLATILVVDHEQSILALVQDCLRDAGYRVVAAPCRGDALIALRSFRFDLVLAGTFAGVDRADDDPWATVESIRQAAGGTPVAIFTAHNPCVYADFRERGFAGVIVKPFDLDTLVVATARLVASV
jgi:CheY-like chemotaxis protein